MHLNKADLFAVLAKIGNRLTQRVANRAHRDHHAVRIRRAIVVEELIIAARERIDLVHVCFDDLREGKIPAVRSLSVLEEDIIVFAGVADGRMLRIQRAFPEGRDGVPVDQAANRFRIDHFDLLDLVRGTEAVKEVLHRQAALNGRQMRHGAHVHTFLHARGRQLRPAGLTAGHDVGLVAENGDGVGGHRAGCNVHDRRKQQAGDAVHRRDHQHQALRGRIGGRQRACLQRALHGCACAGFRLHFHELDRLAKQIFLSMRRPFVHMVGHRAGRGDRVDCRDLGKGIGCERRGLIAVHGLKDLFLRHDRTSKFKLIALYLSI